LNPSLIDTHDQESDGNGSVVVNGGLNGYSPGLRSGPRRPGSGRARRHITRLQRGAAALIAAACVFAAAWYVPRIAAADGRSLAGTVTSNGVVYLNFSGSGQLAAIDARPGQQVRKGQLLAAEAAPAAVEVMAADRAAIAADQAQLAAAHAAGHPAAIASAQAALAKDRAQLAVDRAQAAGTRIVAPAAGTVVAVNGQPGETADVEGIRDYSAQPQGTPVAQRPLFSLFPEGPQSSVEADASAGSLPVIALRTSNTWQVTVLVPEASVSGVRAGQAVTIDVPTAGLAGIPGRVQEVLTTPVVTSQGVAYQAVVSVVGHRPDAPPTGMAADVQLGS
jgi:membrane fusion protein, macrolide-specific efflux system